MSYTPASLTGRIFDNTHDKRNSRSPDYSGTCNIEGQIFRVIGWYNPPSENSKLANINLKFQDKDEFDQEQAERRIARAARRTAREIEDNQEDFDDDIPF